MPVSGVGRLEQTLEARLADQPVRSLKVIARG
jgi:hypothetical protein